MNIKIWAIASLISGFAFASVRDTIPGFPSRLPAMPEALGKCDACGCSASGGSMGFSSMLTSKYVGIRYVQQRYQSRDGIFANSPWVDENFNTWQLWTKFPVTKKIQMIALMPYHAHNRKRASGTESISGFGDLTVLAYYPVWKTKNDTAVWKHSVMAGGGFKAPTGKHDSANNAGSVNPSFQIGTGSWDYLLAGEYAINRKNAGLQLTANYVFKTENNKEYRFGNQLNYGATLFCLFEPGDFKLMPQAGVAGEKYEANQQFGLALPDTAGDVFFAKLGVEAGKGKLSVGLNAMLPVAQNLNGGMVEARHRWSLNLNYNL